MPDETVLDGEVVALDAEGRPSFNALQNRGPGEPLHFFIFDLLILRGRDVMAEPLVKRRALIEKHVLPTLADPIRYSPILEASLPNLICSVKEQGLEGLVAKRRDSKYEPGERSGAWHKMRVNQVAGVRDWRVHDRRPALRCADLRVLGWRSAPVCRADPERVYAGRARAVAPEVPGPGDAGVSVRESAGGTGGRWGEGLTAAKMKNCRWLKPVLVGEFEFVEWTPDKHLRHSRFVGLRATETKCP